MADRFEQRDSLVTSFGDESRVEARVYSGGIHAPEIHIIERYARRADGVRELGGRLITTVPYEDDAQAKDFVSRFTEAVANSGLEVSDPSYDGTSETRSKIKEIALSLADGPKVI